jgi:hypothetical protein
MGADQMLIATAFEKLTDFVEITVTDFKHVILACFTSPFTGRLFHLLTISTQTFCMQINNTVICYQLFTYGWLAMFKRFLFTVLSFPGVGNTEKSF